MEQIPATCAAFAVRAGVGPEAFRTPDGAALSAEIAQVLARRGGTASRGSAGRQRRPHAQHRFSNFGFPTVVGVGLP